MLDVINNFLSGKLLIVLVVGLGSYFTIFVFTSILYNYYLGENNLRFLLGEKRSTVIVYRGLVLVLIFWGAVQNLDTVFAFVDITMTMLAFVNLIAIAMLFNVGMRVLRDYDQQRKAGIKTPIFDSSKFKDLDLDFNAWPPRPTQNQNVTEPATPVVLSAMQR